MGFFDFIPIIGDAIDGVFGLGDTAMTNKSNKDIAAMNIEMQRETNEMNRKNIESTNKWNHQNVVETNKANQQIAQQYNANQVQLQNDMNVFNKQMWDLNNQYNSPQQQLARAQAAGINPNIVFGQPVASSPVQQTSVPSQALPHVQSSQMQSYQARAPHNDMKYQSKGLQQLGKALRGLSRLPIYKEEYQQLQAKTRSDKAHAALLEEEAKKAKERRNAWEHMSVIKSLDGRYSASPEEFDSMSDDDKKLFVRPYAYKDTRFQNRYINSLDNISESERHFYQPLYDFSKVNFEKLGLHSVEEYEDYKKRHSYGNTMLEIRADSARNRLQLAVDEGKVKDRGVVHALIHMDEERYNQLVEVYKRLKRENQWDVEDRPFDLEMRGLSKRSIESAASHDFFTYIDKLGNGDMSAADYVKMLLVGLHDILTGGASYAPYLFSKKK